MDDDRLRALLQMDRDAVVSRHAMPAAAQALWRIQLASRRRRARRVTMFVEAAAAAAAGALALALLGIAAAHVKNAEGPSLATARLAGTVLVTVGIAVLVALLAMRDTRTPSPRLVHRGQ